MTACLRWVLKKMQKGPLPAKQKDRTNLIGKFLDAMSELYPPSKAPPSAQMFGNAGLEHMKKYGTTPDHFAKIAYKNHKHSVNNPYAQFRTEYSLEEIKKSPIIHGFLTKLQCCPTSDGAAAAILASESFVHRHGLEHQAVEIVGMEMSTDLPSSYEDKSCMKLVGYDMTKNAIEKLYAKTGIKR